MTGLILPIVYGLLIGSLWSCWHVTLIRWRLSGRREAALTQVIDAFVRRDNAMIADGADEEHFAAIAHALVALSDELYAQTTRSHFWTRVPRVGKPWPNAEPAPLLDAYANRAA